MLFDNFETTKYNSWQHSENCSTCAASQQSSVWGTGYGIALQKSVSSVCLSVCLSSHIHTPIRIPPIFLLLACCQDSHSTTNHQEILTRDMSFSPSSNLQFLFLSRWASSITTQHHWIFFNSGQSARIISKVVMTTWNLKRPGRGLPWRHPNKRQRFTLSGSS